MSNEVIKDNLGRILGVISSDRKGILTIKDALGKILGTYDPKTNTTKNYLGQIIGTGNQLTRLIK
jgi:hypothetical protein